MNDQERAAFEAWGRAEGLDDSNGYGMDYPLGRQLWAAWQAGRAALAAAPVQLMTADEARKDREHAEAYYRQAEELLTSNEKTLHEEVARLRAMLAAAPAAPQVPAVPLAWIPADVLGQLQPPRLRLLSVPLVTYSAEGHVPIYAAPGAPQPAEQAPLTDGQIDTLSQNHWAAIRQDAMAAHRAFANPIESHRAFARAIEAAHGIRAAGVKEPPNAQAERPSGARED